MQQTEYLKHIQLSGDSEFIKLAQYFRRTKDMNLQDYVTLRDMIIKRCKLLGYDFIQGCCGVNELKKST